MVVCLALRALNKQTNAMMDIRARKQYMDTLREKYLKSSKKGKGTILDEYCRNTGQERKYVIKKFRYKVRTKENRKPRKEKYGGDVKAVLVKMWEIFDYPCGQRLGPSIKDELERLRRQKEIVCAEETAKKLYAMGTATIDRKLKHEKEVLLFNKKYKAKNPLLSHQIPVKTSADFDRSAVGHVQVDFVEHCGSSAAGEYANSMAFVDVSSAWWEAEAVMGKGQERAFEALKLVRGRLPFPLLGIHPDNQSNLINYHLCRYAEDEGIEFTRSRPYKKNDNCFVEQKNWTHVRKIVGYLRYDTKEELTLLGDLYRDELRLYKNFFQPVIKLKSKTRIGGKIHKKYDEAKTPHRRLMESGQISDEAKMRLKEIYESLNPAELKRNIDKKLALLYKAYQKKNGSPTVAAGKKLNPSMVSFHLMNPREVSVS